MSALCFARSLPAVCLAWLIGCAGMPDQAPVATMAEDLAEDAVRAAPPEVPGSSEVRFDSEPQGAELIMDNRLRGVTPLSIPSLPRGRYKIEARKQGYRAFVEWVDHPGTGARYTLVMRRFTGRLAVAVAPAGARVAVARVAGGVAGVDAGAGVHELPVGVYRVRASAFGYLDAEQTVEIEEDATASVEIALDPAPFAARLAGVSRRRLNPDLRGDAGSVVVAWETTAPAEATLRVLAQTGAEVYTASGGSSERPRAEIAWDGRTRTGQPAADGTYRLLLTVRSVRGEEARLETGLVVSRRPLVRPASQWSGVAGLQYASTPEVAEPGAGTFFFSSGLVMAPGEDALVESAPVVAAVRAGIAPRLEIDAALGGLLVDEPPLPLIATAAIKRALPVPVSRLSAAAVARASLQTVSGSDTFTAFTGIGVGLAVGLDVGPLTIVASPEIAVSPWRVTGDDSYDDETRLNAWGYLRAGLALRLPGLVFAMSTAARTAPFADGLAMDEPLAVGAEGHWSPRGSRLFVTLWAGAEVADAAIDRALAGASFGYLY